MPGIFQKGGLFSQIGSFFGKAVDFITNIPNQIIDFGQDIGDKITDAGQTIQDELGGSQNNIQGFQGGEIGQGIGEFIGRNLTFIMVAGIGLLAVLLLTKK